MNVTCLGPALAIRPVLVLDNGKRLAGLLLVVNGLLEITPEAPFIGLSVAAIGGALMVLSFIGSLAIETSYADGTQNSVSVGLALPSRRQTFEQTVAAINAVMKGEGQ